MDSKFETKLVKMYKYMKFIEKTAEDPKTIGLQKYYSQPVYDLLNFIQQKPVFFILA